MPLKDADAKRAYHRDYMRRKFAEDPEFKTKHLRRIRRNNEKYREQSLSLIQAFKENGCCLCSEKEVCCLSAHHLEDAKKDFAIGDALHLRRSPARVKAELEKCICVCENCHRKIHAGKIVL